MPEYLRLPIDEVELDFDNPRIKKFIEQYEEVTPDNLALALGSGPDASALKESIRVSGGLINPIIVNRLPNGRQIVIEGNTRLQIYKEFRDNNVSGDWNTIIALVYDDLPKDEIHSIRLQTHLVGPRDWDPFSKAKYLNQLYSEEKLPMTEIISMCGNKASEIKKLIAAYNDMVKYFIPKAEEQGFDRDAREFSKFSELQNTSIKTALYNHNFNENDFSQWVIDGRIDTAQGVRQLPRILNDKNAREKFLKSNITKAVSVINVDTNGELLLSKADFVDVASELLLRIKNISHTYVKNLTDNPNYEKDRDVIDDLNYELSNLWDDIKEEN